MRAARFRQALVRKTILGAGLAVGLGLAMPASAQQRPYLLWLDGAKLDIAKIILVTDAKGAAECGIEPEATIILPDMDPTFAPIVYALPIQMIAYQTAVFMGKDVDQPRNLAKSVTVE